MTTFKSRGFLSPNARISAKSAKLFSKRQNVQKAFETFKSRGFLPPNARISAKSAKLFSKRQNVQKAFETCQVHHFQIST